MSRKRLGPVQIAALLEKERDVYDPNRLGHVVFEVAPVSNFRRHQIRTVNLGTPFKTREKERLKELEVYRRWRQANRIRIVFKPKELPVDLEPSRTPLGSVDRMPTLAEIQRNYSLKIIETTGGNLQKAADILGVSVQGLRLRVKKWAKELKSCPRPVQTPTTLQTTLPGPHLCSPTRPSVSRTGSSKEGTKAPSTSRNDTT